MFGLLICFTFGYLIACFDLSDDKPKNQSPEKQKNTFTGCPKGTVASEGWGGEYPEPIVQVNKSITLKGRQDVCEHEANLNCTLKAGLYHPWATTPNLKFKAVAAIKKFITLKEVDFGDFRVPKDTVVIEQFYAAEGQCGLIVNGKSVESDCPSNTLPKPVYKEQPSEAKDFQDQQYFSAKCTEGHRAWIHVTEELLKKTDIQEGALVGFGEIEATPLPGGGEAYRISGRSAEAVRNWISKYQLLKDPFGSFQSLLVLKEMLQRKKQGSWENRAGLHILLGLEVMAQQKTKHCGLCILVHILMEIKLL